MERPLQAKCYKSRKIGHFQRMCKSATVNDLITVAEEEPHQFLRTMTQMYNQNNGQ